MKQIAKKAKQTALANDGDEIQHNNHQLNREMWRFPSCVLER